VSFFVLTMVHGPRWDSSRSIREQEGWDQHAAFMDHLVAEKLVILGGPIGDGQRVMVVVEAVNEDEIKARFGEDPWAAMELLRIGLIEPWTVWLHAGRAGQAAE
jgi:uncharacterized protein YciI